MSDLVDIGHAIITYPRCGAPRHVPVAARCVLFACNKREPLARLRVVGAANQTGAQK